EGWEGSPEGYLRSIAKGANERIHRLAQADSTRSGMGTTLTAALLDGDEVSLAHVGDSRAYRFRDGHLKLLTSDHSLVEELRRQGRLTDEQAEAQPSRAGCRRGGAGGRRRRGGRRMGPAPGLFPGKRPVRPARALPRAALRTAARAQALLGAVRGAGPGREPARQRTLERDQPRAPL